jgi:hypothetical protein
LGGAAAVGRGNTSSGSREVIAAYFDSRASSYKPSHPMQHKVNSAQVNLLVSTHCAEPSVANDEFKTLIAILDPRAGLMSRRGVSREVQNLIVAPVAHLKSELFDAAIVHINTKMWTSFANEPFGSFSATWINNKRDLRTAARHWASVPGRHTADAIAAVLSRFAVDFGIKYKVGVVRAHGASNCVWLAFGSGCRAHRVEEAEAY